MKLSHAQHHMLNVLLKAGGEIKYLTWINFWYIGPRAFAVRNSERTINALMRKGLIERTDDGCFALTESGRQLAMKLGNPEYKTPTPVYPS